MAPPVSPQPELALIVAMARGGVIGRDNRLPWHLPEDLKHFRACTTGAPVLMGRNTWLSLPERFRPLPGRHNIVLSRQPGFQAPGATVAGSLDLALAAATAHGPVPRVWVIGGAALYAEALPRADALVVTEIDADFDGDAHFPRWDRAAFTEVSREAHTAAAPNGFGFAFVRYRRPR